MTYEKTLWGTFISRPNRFIAHVMTDSGEVICHVKNTGRCRELLIPGTPVVLADMEGVQKRKTRYDLIAVKKGERLINIDSQAPNKAAGELLKRLYPTADVRSEVKVGESRIDFCVEENGKLTYVEVKGVTLEDGGVVSFPDAPTLRGIKHLKELSALSKKGCGAAVLFIVQMKNVKYFTPNRKTHPQFADELLLAQEKGVSVTAFECDVTEDSMTATSPVEILL